MVDIIYIALLPLACLILYWLRATIDQQKGVLVEVLGVTLPICLVAVGAWMFNPAIDIYSLGVILTPVVVLVFWAMPVLAAARMCERLLQREQPQLADLFRITTVTALAIFVVRQLEIEMATVSVVLVITFMYWIGDTVALNRARWSYGFWILAALLGLISLFMVVVHNDIGPMRWNRSAFPAEPIFATLLIPALAPSLLHWVGNRLFVRLGPWIEALRLRIVRPSESIYHRTLFRLWHFRHGVCYLNHGSFGAVPRRIEKVQRAWQVHCMAEPMDVLARETEPAWQRSRDRLAEYLGSPPECLALSQNATEAMNEIAAWFPLEPGDEVLLTDHEYGAVKRIWERRAEKSSARASYVTLPMPFDEPHKIVDAILSACNERTRIVVFSHITSPTAVILPVAEICQQLRQRNIASCVDGPHALLQERVRLEELGCDFYTASCHKWLCAPLGSGLVYVHPRWVDQIEPLRLSWGRLPPGRPVDWTDELTWIGTRDYSPYMAIPAAIRFFQQFDLHRLDERNHALAGYARRMLSDLLRTAPVTPESRQWMGWMAAVWLPPGDHSGLQQRLWERYSIEVPIVHFADRYLVRVSCHLYNTTRDIDRFARALQRELTDSSTTASTMLAKK